MHGVTRRLAELFSPQYKIALPGIDHLNGGDTLKFSDFCRMKHVKHVPDVGGVIVFVTHNKLYRLSCGLCCI